MRIQVAGPDLKKLGQQLRTADKDIRKELAKSIQRATRPVKLAIKESARNELPASGGLNEWAAALTLKTSQRLSGRNPGVLIVGAKNNKKTTTRIGGRKKKTRSGTWGKRADLRALNRGRVMHPIFGHGDKDGKLVGPQMVQSEWWDTPLKGEVTDNAISEVVTGMQVARDAIAAAARQVGSKSI